MPLTIISRDDFYAFSKAIKLYGWRFLANKLRFKNSERIKSQWDHYQSTGSNWWDIPMVRERWNLKITGELKVSWEEYVVGKYFSGRENLSMLSVGCGTGEKERIFARFLQFTNISGIDISRHTILKAEANASREGFQNIRYRQCDFAKESLEKEVFDLILFNASLHHFAHIEKLVTEKVLPSLKPEGLLVIFEYTGPNRLQYTREQIDAANHCLGGLPEAFRKRKDNSLKKRNYRPGLLRMWFNDPSEAPASEDILSALRKWMVPIEEKPVGGAILHMLLKDIAHNFDTPDDPGIQTLERLFQEEDKFYRDTGQSDFWFGVYGKKPVK